MRCFIPSSAQELICDCETDYAVKQAHVELAERMKKRDAGQSNHSTVCESDTDTVRQDLRLLWEIESPT